MNCHQGRAIYAYYLAFDWLNHSLFQPGTIVDDFGLSCFQILAQFVRVVCKSTFTFSLRGPNQLSTQTGVGRWQYTKRELLDI